MRSLLWPDVAQCSGLSVHQKEQLGSALSGRLGLLLGTPGTGKTYTTGVLVDRLAEDFSMSSIAVCAPTGKAAVRVTAAMHRAGVPIRATTIHQLLEIGRNGHDGDGWGFKRNGANPLEQRFVIIDEASMLDTDLAAAIFSSFGAETHLLMVGDPYQLPPVGHGAPLRDFISAGVPRGELTEIQRNAGLIVQACAKVKAGKPFEFCDRFDPDSGRNLWHIEVDGAQSQIDTLLAIFGKLAANSYNWDPLWDVQVIVATNDSGPLCRKTCNRILQGQLNPTGCGHSDHSFKVGDKIICLRNHWGLDANDPRGNPHYLANGEIGEVIEVSRPGKLMLRFSLPERFILAPVGKGKAEEREGHSGTTTSDFDLAYSITCHKAQGSEFPVAVLLLDSSAGARRVCSREWLYTALSRASQLCITIGNMATAEFMAKRPSLDRRKTFLAERICDGRTSELTIL